MISRVCVIGERLSGTCFINALFSSNTDVKCVSYGNKHFFQDIDKIHKEYTKGTLFVFVTRDVMEWLQSFSRSPFHAPLNVRKSNDFSKFIRLEWKCIYDETYGTPRTHSDYGKEMMHERDPYTGERFENAIKMRTSKIDHCMALSKVVENFVHVRYEDARDDPEGFMRKICMDFELMCTPVFVPVTTPRGQGGSKAYIRYEYENISEDDVEYIISNIDKDTEKSIGYM